MARAGLLIEKDGGGFYDRFRHRVVFVIRDTRGRAIGFGGRVIDDAFDMVRALEEGLERDIEGADEDVLAALHGAAKYKVRMLSLLASIYLLGKYDAAAPKVPGAVLAIEAINFDEGAE